MKDQCLPMDLMSRLPENIIEMILTLMPLRDAVRTSILSTKWRSSWVKIPKLVCDWEQFNGLTGNNQNTMPDWCHVFCAMNQVLLLHQGPLLEFTLLNYSGAGRPFELDLIILQVSRKNTLKKFTFGAWYYKLPSSFYSLQQLTHLDLWSCELHPPLTFNGFSMLISLSLRFVQITEEVLLHLISGCPILKHFTLFSDFRFQEGYIVQLFKCLNVIEHLKLYSTSTQGFFTGGVPRKLPTSLVHLKHFDLSAHCLMGRDEFCFTLLLIRSSPNLKKIKIKMNEGKLIEEIDDFIMLQDYADVRLNHLIEFEVEYYTHSTIEFELLKLILVKSPVLIKVRLKLTDVGSDKEEIHMLRSFLRLPHASPIVDIIVQRRDAYE